MPQRPLTLLGIVLALQLALAAALALRGDPLAAAAPGGPLLALPLAAVDGLVIEGPVTASGQAAPRIQLALHDGHWQLASSAGAPADANRVHTLLTRLAGLKRSLPTATSHAAGERFKVADAAHERRLALSQKGKTLATLYLGESSGLRQSFARLGGSDAVYVTDLPAYEVPDTSSDWLDPGLLAVHTEQLTGLELKAGDAAALVLHRAAGGGPPQGTVPEWRADALPPGRHLDAGRVSTLLGAIGATRPGGVLGTTLQADWPFAHPALALRFEAPGGASSWTMAKPKTGDDYVLKSSAHPWYFSIPAYQARALLDDSAAGALWAAPAKGAAK